MNNLNTIILEKENQFNRYQDELDLIHQNPSTDQQQEARAKQIVLNQTELAKELEDLRKKRDNNN